MDARSDLRGCVEGGEAIRLVLYVLLLWGIEVAVPHLLACIMQVQVQALEARRRGRESSQIRKSLTMDTEI